MANKLLTEADIKKELNIKDFRSISKDKLTKFVSNLPKMDKEVAIKIINQFPNYISSGTQMVHELIGLCDKALESSKETDKEAINAYKKVLERIDKEMEDGEITPEERKEYTNKMIEVADKINDINKENKKWLKDILAGTATAMGVVLVVGAAILGVEQNK